MWLYKCVYKNILKRLLVDIRVHFYDLGEWKFFQIILDSANSGYPNGLSKNNPEEVLLSLIIYIYSFIRMSIVLYEWALHFFNLKNYSIYCMQTFDVGRIIVIYRILRITIWFDCIVIYIYSLYWNTKRTVGLPSHYLSKIKYRATLPVKTKKIYVYKYK